MWMVEDQNSEALSASGRRHHLRPPISTCLEMAMAGAARFRGVLLAIWARVASASSVSAPPCSRQARGHVDGPNQRGGARKGAGRISGARLTWAWGARACFDALGSHRWAEDRSGEAL